MGKADKSGKSSASKGTRQKHARKAAGKDDEEASTAGAGQRKPQQQRGQKKLSKAQRKALPKIKQYIPPPKPPAPPIPDPLDGQGLARTLPAELVVVLRRLGKKDDVTRRKGLDELREQWVAPLLADAQEDDEEVHTEREIRTAALEAAIPVWLHNLAPLLVSPSQRSQVLQLHTELLAVPVLRGVILDSIAMEYLPGTQSRDILGSWLIAVLEDGRRGAATAYKTWEEAVRFGPGSISETTDSEYTHTLDITPHLPALAEYLTLATLDPETLHRDIHPAPVQSVFTPQKTKEPAKKGKGGGKAATPARAPTPPPPAEDPEVTEERWARYRVGGLVGLAWLVQKLPENSVPVPEELVALLANPVLWSALGETSHLPDLVPIGTQPPIRRAAYILLATFVDAYPAQLEQPDLLRLVSATVLGNCWAEQSPVVWEAAGPAVVKFLTKYPQAWALAASESNDDDDDGDDGDDGDNGDDDDEDDDDEGGNETTEPPSRASGAATPLGPTSSKAFDAFLNFISTICPSVPHLTYLFFVVVISTLPPTLLPLSSPLSLPLQNLFSHLWSPVDARLLSTVALGGQPSAFQAFIQAAVDVTVSLTDKAAEDVAQWLVKEQLGARVWGEGVILYGAKGGRRGSAPVETEAAIVGKAISRVVAVSSELATLFTNEVERTTLAACFTDDKHAFLPRALPALTALRAGSPAIEAAVDGTLIKVAQGCTEHIFQHVSDEARAPAAVQADALIALLNARPDLFPPERVEVLSQGLQAHIPEVVATLPSATAAALFAAVAARSAEADRVALVAALWAYVDGVAEQSSRFAFAAGMLEADTAGLFGAGSLDTVGAEAARAALASDDAVALTIASKAVIAKDWMSDSARNAVLTSVCDVVHDTIDGMLSDAADATAPVSALAILAAYAKDNLVALVALAEHIHAVVAVHHLVVLFPRIQAVVSIPATAAAIWAATAALPSDAKAVLSAAISRSLAELLGRVSCRVAPDTLVDVALATELGSDATPTTVAATLLPAEVDLLAHLTRHTTQPPNPTLPVIDALVPCTAGGDEPSTRAQDFDTAGRSRAARYAEAALALLRADRSLVHALPHLLHVALAAMLLARDGAAVPGASRGLYTPATPAAHLESVVRAAEGALSFSLSLVDEAPLEWHKAAVEFLRAGAAGPNADYLQRLLADLGADVAAQTSDVAPRAFREVLGRHLRKSGAGEAEGEVWLNYAMAMSAKRRFEHHFPADLPVPEIALAVILSIKPFMLDAKAFATAQNRLANALTGISVRNANTQGLPALRLLVASAPPPDAASLFIPQQRAVFALRHVGGWLTSEDEAADELEDELDVRIAELYIALAPIVQDLSGAHWDAIFDLISGALGSTSLDDLVSYPLMHAGLLLLKEVRDLCATNKGLRELWTQKDEHLGLVVTLFLQARDADSEPLQEIHALILDLLTDASDKVMAAAGLPELCALLRLSSSPAIQSTAYRLLAQVIRARTIALVLEVEAAVAAEEAEEHPHEEREIRFPPALVDILEAGRAVDWHDDGAHLQVQFVEAQLLAWMAVMDHFDDAVS
jgi:hypothetical protein